jgi:hypothetical protein
MAVTARKQAKPEEPLAFLREVIWRAAPRAHKAECLRHCLALEARAEDRKLYLAVVGEDAADKAALIAALGDQPGWVIVDTPDVGADPTFARHVMGEVADAILVAIPAARPMSPLMSSFVRDVAEPFLHRGLFVVTGLDAIPEREREDVIGHVRAELWKHVGLRRALILETGADPAATRALAPVITDAMVRQRRDVLAERTVRLLRTVLLDVRGALTEPRLELGIDDRIRKERAASAIEDELARLLHEPKAERRPRSTTRAPRAKPQA